MTLTSFKALALMIFVTQQTALASAQVQLTGVSSGGSGCPQGTVQVVLAPDASTISVLYDQFHLQVHPGAPTGTLQCQVTVDLKKPRFIGLSVESADFRGFVALDSGMQAKQDVVVMSGTSNGVRRLTAEFATQTWQGPINSETLTTTQPLRKSHELLDCIPPKENTKIIIQTRVTVRPLNQGGNGAIAIDTADGRVNQRYHLSWKNCARGGGRFR